MISFRILKRTFEGILNCSNERCSPISLLIKRSQSTLMMYRGNQHRSNWRRPFSRGRRSNYGERNMGDREIEDRSAHRHPPHLRGRAIGMFYAKKGRSKKVNRENQERSVVNLSNRDELEVVRLLETVRTKEYPVSSISRDWRDVEGIKLFPAGVKVLLERNAVIDEQLYCELAERTKSEKYLNMLSFRKTLPAFKMREDILKLVKENQVIVITGETGCGKTTQVPQYILESYINSLKGSICRIVCTQPRRISAISVAERVAQERGVSCGGVDVGYQIRLESKIPRGHGCILYCTTGILLQQLNAVSQLDGISHVIVDEVHEQDLQSDFLLINLKDILKVRKDLKVILMSATLNAEKFASYFGNCPMLNIPGFTFPVEVFSLEDMIEITNYRFPLMQKPYMRRVHGNKTMEKAEKERLEEKKRMKYLNSIRDKYSDSTIESLKNWDEKKLDLDLIVAMLRHINSHEREGAVLVFVPGWQEISRLNRMITEDPFFSLSRFRIIPLHSLMPTVSQREVFENPPKGVQKIVLATNIAETSITIDDIVYVIDCGKIKMKSLDPVNNIQLLQPEWVSKSNMKQRRGRAGRTQPGKCYHMLTKLKESELEMYPLPEMLRSTLEELILKVKILKLGSAAPFLSKAMCPPEEKIIRTSLNTLQRLNALTPDEELTPLGYHLARLPMDPRSGKMILFGAIFSCLDPILTVAASLSFKDAFLIPLGKEEEVDHRKIRLAEGCESDHLMFAKAMKQWEEAERRGRGSQFCYANFLSQSTLRLLANLKTQYTEYLSRMHFLHISDPKNAQYNRNSDNELLLKAVICAGLYPNAAKVISKRVNRRKLKTIKARSDDGLKVSLHPKSVNAYNGSIKANWLVYHLKLKSADIYLHDTTSVSPYSLLFFGNKLEPGDVNGNEIISVDDWIVFQCSRRKADLFLELRKELDGLLEYKICKPGVSDWQSDSKEAVVLKCITKLLSSEEMKSTTNFNADFEQDDSDQEGNSACSSSAKTVSTIELESDSKQEQDGSEYDWSSSGCASSGCAVKHNLDLKLEQDDWSFDCDSDSSSVGGLSSEGNLSVPDIESVIKKEQS